MMSRLRLAFLFLIAVPSVASAHIQLVKPNARIPNGMNEQKNANCGSPGWVRAQHPDFAGAIENAHGENLFQYLDRFDPSDVTYDQVAAKLRGELIERRTMPEFEKWMVEVRKNRYVEVVAPELQ